MNEWKPAEQAPSNPEAGETLKPSENCEAALLADDASTPPLDVQVAVEVVFLPAAEKDLDKIGRGKHLAQIVKKLDELESNPLPADARPIKGEQYRAQGWNFYRVDVGEYRIVYDLDESSQVLTIVTIAVIGARNDDKVYKTMERRFS